MTSNPNVTLADISRIIQGGRLKYSGNDFVLSGYPAYGAGGVNGYLPVSEFDGPGVVLSSIGARCGKCFYADGKWTSLANTQIILPHPDHVDARFLWYQLNDEERWPRSGTAQPFIKPSDVKAHRVFLPSLQEQRRIAAILDEADALRAKRRVALAHLDEMAQAIFVEMFGDALSNSKGWPQQRCANLCKRITVGVVVRPASYYQNTGIPAIRGTNIKVDGIDMTEAVYFSSHDNENTLSKSRVWKGDIVIVRTGRPGLAAIVPECLNGANAIDIIIATPDMEKVRSRFLCELLNSDAGRAITLAESKGQIQQHFNVGSFSDAQIMVPPLDLQIAFEERMAELMRVRQSFATSAANQESLFASLQHRAFRGEL